MAERQDFDHADLAVQAGGQNVAAFDACRRFEHTLPVDADTALLDQLCSKAAGFRKPRIPQPLVEALFLPFGQMSILRLQLLLKALLELAQGREGRIGIDGA